MVEVARPDDHHSQQQSGAFMTTGASNVEALISQLPSQELAALVQMGIEITRCRELGQAAHQLLLDRRFTLAAQGYGDVVDLVWSGQSRDVTLLSKATIGLMVAHMSIEDYEWPSSGNNCRIAHGIWLSKPEDEPYGLAILALDQHRASNRDLLVYWLLEATFRSMSADRATATEEIDDLFPRIIGFTKECVPDALAQVIKKMFQCYFHISGGRGASEIATRLHKMAPQLSVEEIQRPCWYPEPDDWAYEDAQQFQMFTPHGQVISITNAELRRLCELYRP